MKSLKIFKASAGSGKTFTLTVEYIKLLIVNQSEYKHTLAVTFTNKATAEMKQRILSTLYGVQYALPASQNYYERIVEAPEIKRLNIDETEVRRRAGVALHNLLHDYARFRIETIDSFFLSVVRDISREMDLTANLNIDLDSDEVLSEAVDDIIDQLREGTPVMNTIKRFVDEKIAEGGQWKINEEVKNFGRNIFNEKFLEQGHLISNVINDKEWIRRYGVGLYALQQRKKNDLKTLAGSFIQLCDMQGIPPEHFSQKNRGVYGFFSKLSEDFLTLPTVNSYVLKCLDDPKAWFAKGCGNEMVATEHFMPILRTMLSLHAEYKRISNTVDSITKHLNHLVLLGEIDKRVQVLNTDANRFLLASTAHLLSRMIDKNSVPFIYEKSGTTFRHIMIDEFQDTSALQWRNFLPLLMNSLDCGEMCLIVGDVKQSIYRWRNSDWQILNGINENPDFRGRILPQAPLNFNRRSLGNIISFNNAFFTNAVQALNLDYRESHNGKDSESLLRAYDDVCQEMVEKNKGLGYVSVECLQGTDSGDSFDYSMRTYERIVELVDELISKGVNPNDICILTRRNKHVPAITQAFADAGSDIKVVSNEAYQLRASSALSILVSAIRFLAKPDDRTNLFMLVISYLSKVKGMMLSDTDIQHYLLMPMDELVRELPEEFTANADKLVLEPLIELIERIFAIFSLGCIQGQDAYLFFFHDCLLAFTDNNVPDVDVFLRYWEDVLSFRTIPGGAADGVRIMSIHKSKGLEFQTVIVPFCDWEMTGKSTELLWCTPEEAPYDEMKLVAVNFRKELADSIFAEEYDDEVLRYNVDNLNLLYVAFTRPKANLIVLTCDDSRKKEGPISRISHLMARSLPAIMEHETDEEIGDVWTMGEIVPSRSEEGKGESGEKSRNVLEFNPEPVRVEFFTQLKLPEFLQSNDSEQFIDNLRREEEALEAEPKDADAETVTAVGATTRKDSRSYVDRGLLYHNIYQQIIHADDAPVVIEKMKMKGLFRSEEERREVEADVMRSLADPVTGKWFDDSWRVVNERTILCRQSDGRMKEYRPDRVIMSSVPDNHTASESHNLVIVIDYKTGRYDEEHFSQVRTYMQHLHNMGYPEVRGYVWYLQKGKVYRVKSV